MEAGKKLILLVDDNPTNLRLGVNVLKEKYNAITAPSAEKMFGLLETNSPAMILLDVEMPELSGYEAIRILKENPKTQDIPVVFVTARTDSEDELAGLSLGAIDYITKPFRPALLLKRIEVHLLVESQRKELKGFNENLQKMVVEKTQDIIELKNALLKTMAEMVEYRDFVTGGHIERTQQGIKILMEKIKEVGLF
jgi:putative two-component system response regulator